MRKRTSKRRWKARCALGRKIPLTAIMNYELDRWWQFEHAAPMIAEYYRATAKAAIDRTPNTWWKT